MIDNHRGNFLTKILPLKSSEKQRPTILVLAAQVNSRTTEEDLHDLSVVNLMGVTPLLSGTFQQSNLS